MIKLFAIDMDGTLLNTEHNISESSKEAVNKLNEAGVRTVLTSGRVASSINYHNEILGIANPVIGNNGAVVLLNDEIIDSHPLTDNHLEDLVDFCVSHKLIFNFYDESTFYTNMLINERLDHLKILTSYGLNYQCNISVSADPIKTMREANKEAYKIIIAEFDNTPYSRDEVAGILKEKLGDELYITSSGPNVLEIMEAHVNKWEGIKVIADHLGIKEEEIAAIGDSLNDLPMIENAEIGIAMGNAHDSLKDIASFTVGDNNTTGIADAADIILNLNKENPSV